MAITAAPAATAAAAAAATRTPTAKALLVAPKIITTSMIPKVMLFQCPLIPPVRWLPKLTDSALWPGIGPAIPAIPAIPLSALLFLLRLAFPALAATAAVLAAFTL